MRSSAPRVQEGVEAEVEVEVQVHRVQRVLSAQRVLLVAPVGLQVLPVCKGNKVRRGHKGYRVQRDLRGPPDIRAAAVQLDLRVPQVQV